VFSESSRWGAKKMKKLVMLLVLLMLASMVSAAPLATSGGTVTAQVGSTASSTSNTGGNGGGGGSSHRQCDDGIDNDNDGKLDMDDPGCVNSYDNNEYDAPEVVLADLQVQDVTGTSHLEDPSLMLLLNELIDQYHEEPSLVDRIVAKIRSFYEGK